MATSPLLPRRAQHIPRLPSIGHTPLPCIRKKHSRAPHSQSPIPYLPPEPTRPLAESKTIGTRLRAGHFYPAPISRSIFDQRQIPSTVQVCIDQLVSKSVVGGVRGVPKAQNQDACFVEQSETCAVIGVCDGHGSNGHHVSNFLASRFPAILLSSLRTQQSLRAALTSTYSDCSRQLKAESIDTANSGSTCTVVALVGNSLACANVGDSRAVLGRCYRGIWSVFQLSWDHKPEVPSEQLRIEAAGGEVKVSKVVHTGPARVYIKNKMSPGLAMSRSMGDDLAAAAGIISEPDIETVLLTPSDKFIVLATDGLWEVMSSLEVVQRVAALRDSRESVCDLLIREAQNRWLRRGPVVDDVTVVIAFLHP